MRASSLAMPSGGEDKVDAARGDGTLGHAGVLGRMFVLGEGEAPGLFDGLHALDPVRGGAGEDDPDGLAALVCRQGSQEGVHRQVAAFADLPGWPGAGRPSRISMICAGGQDIDVIGLRHRAVPGFRHRQHGGLAEDLGQHAVLLGREVLQQDEGHARVLGQVPQEIGEGLQAPGGGSRRPPPGEIAAQEPALPAARCAVWRRFGRRLGLGALWPQGWLGVRVGRWHRRMAAGLAGVCGAGAWLRASGRGLSSGP